MYKRIAAILFVALLAQPAFTQGDVVVDPKFYSSEAKRAVSSFRDRLATLDKKLEERSKLERLKLKSELESALKTAVDKKDFSEIQRISAFLESGMQLVRKPPRTAQAAATKLRMKNEELKRELMEAKAATSILPKDRNFLRAIKGRTYHVAKNKTRLWKFAADGSLVLDGEVAGQWAVLGPKTVVTLLHSSNGVDFFRFAPDGSQFDVGYVGSGNKTNRLFRGILVK